METTCLLIRTKDNRRFLTAKENLDPILEFAKSFRAEIFLVKAPEGSKVLGLDKLAPAICDYSYDTKPTCKVVSRLFPKRNRSTILKEAAGIRKFIQKAMLSGKPLSLKTLKNKYKDLGLTDACLCNHFTAIRKQLETSGSIIKKTGAGEYCLN